MASKFVGDLQQAVKGVHSINMGRWFSTCRNCMTTIQSHVPMSAGGRASRKCMSNSEMAQNSGVVSILTADLASQARQSLSLSHAWQ
jgi:hypothetical protein